MAAATVYNSTFYKDTTNGIPFSLDSPPSGDNEKTFSQVLLDTSLDDAGDFVAYFPVMEGRLIKQLVVDSLAHDTHATPTLDMDVVLRTVLLDGTTETTILYNAGTAFEAAHSTRLDFPTKGSSVVRVPRSKYGYGHVGLLVNVAAATPADPDVATELSIVHT